MGERARHVMPSQRRARPAATRLLRVALAVVTTAVLAVTGFGWWTVHGMLSGITVSQALGADAPRSTGAAVNILLIGLDSRKDQNGNDLPQELLDQLHAGDSTSGGYNTNTLILVHLAEDGSVEAFSIPRDDYVNVSGIVPGYHHIKIKEAYGLTKADEEQKLADDGETDQATLEKQGREAGRKATLAVVRALTGAPIDYFAEVNLAGLLRRRREPRRRRGLPEPRGARRLLRRGLPGRPPDARRAAGAGVRQAAPRARQRRPGPHPPPAGVPDLGHPPAAGLRIVQRHGQAQLADGRRPQGHRVVRRLGPRICSAGSADCRGDQVHYQTLPVVRYDTIYGQDVNIVDPAAIRALVAKTFSGRAGRLRRRPTPVPSRPTSRWTWSTPAGVTGSGDRDVEHVDPQRLSRRRTEPDPAGESQATVVDYGTGGDPPHRPSPPCSASSHRRSRNPT